MHTREGGGVDEELVAQMEQDLTIRPVLSTITSGTDTDLSGPEDLSLEDLAAEFDKLERIERQEENEGPVGLPLTDSQAVDGLQLILGAVEDLNVAEMFDLSELEKALEGNSPIFTSEDHQVHHRGEGDVVSWDKATLKMIGGLS